MKIQQFKSREDAIWAAGLFEGEGWISVQRFTPAIGIQMSEKDTLERFAAAVGGGPIYYRKPRVYSYEKINARKEQWAWRVTGFQNVQAVIAVLWNWLGLRRRTRAKEVLETAKLGRVRAGMVKGQRTGLPVECGEVKKYWRGCRCNLCVQANKKYDKDLRAKRKEETPPINRGYTRRSA